MTLLTIIVIGVIIFIMFKAAVSTFYKNTDAIPVLMYHHFDEKQSNSITVPRKAFLEQMEALSKAGYTPITQEQMIAFYYEKAKLPKKPILITIDDGYRSNYEIAYPILKQTGMKATIFTVTSQAGQTPNRLPHFSWKEAKLMSKDGTMEIQSHTNNLHHKEEGLIHKVPALLYSFKDETREQYLERIYTDLYSSRKLIKENVGNQALAISYPFGESDKNVIKMAKKAGFKLGYSISGGLNTKYTDPYKLKRINVPGDWSGKELLDAITP